MNFGAFAGGFSGGFKEGVSTAKTIRDVIREGKLQDLRDKGMAEAEAQRASTVQGLIKENGVSDQPTSGPVTTDAPTVAAPAADGAAVATPVAPQTPVEAQELPPLGPKPGFGASSEGTAGEAEAAAAYAAQRSATPPAVAAPAMPAPDAAAPAQGAAPVSAVPNPAAPVVQAAPSAQQGVAATGMAPAAVAAAAPAPAPVVKKPGGKFSVNGQNYDTREQALAAAERAAPSAADLFMKNAVPKIAEQYLVNGDPEKAKAWTDYSESRSGKLAMKDWAAAFTAPDFDTATARFGKYYSDHVNDGVDYTGHKLLTKADGSQVAVVSLKDKATGKTTEMELTREKMLAMGGATNPQKLFEQAQAQQLAADKMKYEAQLKAQERRQTNADNRERDDLKADRDDARWAARDRALDGRAGAGVNAKIDAQVASLRDAGYGDDEIKRMMPAIVGAGDHKKTTDPTERRALVTGDLLKNDPTFSRKTPELQAKQVDDMMTVIYRDEKKPDPVAKPTGNPNAIYRNNETGERFRVIDGKRVPVGAAPPAAGPATGLPKTGGASGGF